MSLRRCRIEVEGATPGHVYEQLDSWHQRIWQEQADRTNEGRPPAEAVMIDTKVTEEVVELVNDGRTVDGKDGYRGRRVFEVYTGVQEKEREPLVDVELPHRTTLVDPEQETARYGRYDGPSRTAEVDRLHEAETTTFNEPGAEQLLANLRARDEVVLVDARSPMPGEWEVFVESLRGDGAEARQETFRGATLHDACAKALAVLNM